MRQELIVLISLIILTVFLFTIQLNLLRESISMIISKELNQINNVNTLKDEFLKQNEELNIILQAIERLKVDVTTESKLLRTQEVVKNLEIEIKNIKYKRFDDDENNYLITRRRRPKLADGCQHVYLDVGSNIGVQVRKLFEPEKYPGSKILPHFDRMFGDVEERRKNVCVFGFEGSTHLTSRLKFVENCYKKLGWRTNFNVPVAVSNYDGGTVRFYRYAKHKGEVANSIFQWTNYDNSSYDEVKTFDFSKFILEEIKDRILPFPENNATVFAKIDIEGSEYAVLMDMVMTRSLCEITDAVIEYHANSKYMVIPTELKTNGKKIELILKSLQELPQNYVKCKLPNLIRLDDETYLSDGKSFPSTCKKIEENKND